MKREFLQGLQVGDTPLPKDIIDAIMAEHGRDMEAMKTRFADYEALKAKADAAEDTANALQSARQWEEKYNTAVQAHEKALSDMAFAHRLETAITAARGRNAKAIAALLDVDAIRSGENQQTALEEALSALKKDCDYLFQTETPPPYARGTGAENPHETKAPATLAGAILEKFERK